MGKLTWYKDRLMAMSKEEVLWRLRQKKIQNREKRSFEHGKVRIDSDCFYGSMVDTVFRYDGSKLPLGRLLKLQAKNVDSKELMMSDYILATLGGLDYKKNKKDWKAGIQTENKWPDVFSYKLDYKGRDDIGDARCNWELNRHFQFAGMACRFCGTGKKKILTELKKQYEDWNEQNPFLIGISWTSVMEVAIRAINWMLVIGYLDKCKNKSRFKSEIQAFEDKVSVGIVNMICYCQTHYSRFSSANNHTLVEAAAIGIAGVLYGEDSWINQANTIITEELEKQVYSDGVGKECSIHYQAFAMEAVGLYSYVLDYNREKVPVAWKSSLNKQLKYLQSCCGKYGEIIVFGDEDEGKIIDLVGLATIGDESNCKTISLSGRRYYDYVIDLIKNVLGSYNKATDDKKEALISYRTGGISILRDKFDEILVGMDHGELGYGSIAAHGHADSLSVRMFYKGVPVLTGPGTYLYHCDILHRDEFRHTKSHNTITVDDKCQSQMLGAFLWGERATTELLSVENTNEKKDIDGEAKLELDEYGQKSCVVSVCAKHDGYAPIIHTRKTSIIQKENVSALELLKAKPDFKQAGVRSDSTTLQIEDRISNCEEGCKINLVYNIGNDWNVKTAWDEKNGFLLSSKVGKLTLVFDIPSEMTETNIEVKDVDYSPVYGELKSQKRIVVSGKINKETMLVTRIKFPIKSSL